jgi:uncharacterized protein (DUF1697 family)
MRMDTGRMRIFISILRGINVGGRRKILMDDLQSLYVELGFERVITFIQSGNVIFQAEKNISDKEISSKIEGALLEKYKFEVAVIVRSLEEMEATLANNPFLSKEFDPDKLHVTFLSEIPQRFDQHNDYSPEKFIISGKDVYLYCPHGYGKTSLSNNFFEQKLKVKASTRNWRTVNKLFEIASEIRL